MAKKKSRKTTSPNVPALTDPHLIALLSYIDGNDGVKEEVYARANQAALAMLTSVPLSSAFDLLLDRPTLYGQICSLMLEESRNEVAASRGLTSPARPVDQPERVAAGT